MNPTGILAIIPSSLSVGEEFEIKIKVLGPIIEIPIAEDKKSKKEEVFKSLGQANTKTVRTLTRGIKVIPVNARTDATCVFTTVEK